MTVLVLTMQPLDPHLSSFLFIFRSSACINLKATLHQRLALATVLRKWRVQVMHLGFFDDELAAAQAYDGAVAAYRGPDAPANFNAADGPGNAQAEFLPSPESR